MDEVNPKVRQPKIRVPDLELVQRRSYREVLVENLRTLGLLAGVAVAAYFGAREGSKSGIANTTWYLDMPPSDQSSNTEDTIVD